MDLLTATIIVRGLHTHSSVAQQERNPRYCLPLWEGPASICQSWRTTPVKHNITIRTLLPISEKSVPLQPKKGNSFNSHHHQFYPRQSCTFSWAFQEHLQNNENYCDRPSAGLFVWLCFSLTTMEVQVLCLNTVWLFVWLCFTPPQKRYNVWAQRGYLCLSAWSLPLMWYKSFHYCTIEYSVIFFTLLDPLLQIRYNVWVQYC